MEGRLVSSELFWIKDVYYFEDSTKRWYLCHDNTFVYTPQNKKIEFWRRAPNTNYYIIPVGNCDQIVSDNFLVMGVDHKIDGPLMKNGVVVETNSLGFDGWFAGWVKSKFHLPGTFVVGGLFPLNTSPESRVSQNKIFFSVENLLSLTDYDVRKKKIRDIEDKARKIPITRKYYPFITELPEDFPKKKWKNERSSNIHFGQLKLLLSEIEFLTKIAPITTPVLVLYPGGGPGDHVPLLSQMFPNIYFVLVDPVFGTEASSIKIVPDEKIIIRPELFTEEYISQFKNLKISLAMISDIRSLPPADIGTKGSKSYETEFEKHAKFDMDLQQSWYKDLRGPSTLLKFRVPYVAGDTRYLCGHLYLQAYPPELSTELRLVPNPKECVYSNTDIEEKMFYFNTEYRNHYFYDIDPLFGKNYDTLREMFIISRFLEWRAIDVNQKNIFGMFVLIDNFFQRRRISEFLLQ